ncbi:MAG: hypothetical protein LC659_04365 [Myxococcales bacterium]|nr:hypothetical protein [Myxococcales bacterium]
MRKRIALLALCTIAAGGIGCAPLAREHRGDAAFRNAVAAQLAYDEPRAEALYRQILALGLDWSPVWNNLAVIAVHRHQYSSARKLLAHAVAANERDVVALTNYGVMSYHLSDYAEARRTLEAARRLRTQIIDSIPSMGRATWQEDQYARATAPLDDTAKRYLARIDSATLSDAPLPAADLMADLQLTRF